MRAAFLKSEGHLAMTETESPAIQDANQVLVQVKTVGVCGSEVHAFHGTHPHRVAPVVLGHEAAGVVLDVGEAVTRFHAGDRVIIDPQWTCGECDYCRAGDLNLCLNKKVLGTPSWPGAFGEHVVAPEESVFQLPKNLSFVQGSLIEPLTIAVHVARRANLKAGESVAVLGTGSIGGLLTGVCRARGADPIIAVDVHRHCLDTAHQRLGATHTFLTPDEKLVQRVQELTGGVDVVFITGDDTVLVTQGVQMAKRRGRIVLVALLTTSPLQLRAYDIISKELTVLGSVMSNHKDVQSAIELAASRQVDVEAIATHALPIEDAQRGLELARTKDDGAIKVILSFMPVQAV